LKKTKDGSKLITWCFSIAHQSSAQEEGVCCVKKSILLLIPVFLFGIFFGGLGMLLFGPLDLMPAEPAAAATMISKTPVADSSLDAAMKAAAYFRDGDYAALADMVHPRKGVLFVPYSTVNPAKNLCFTADQVRAFSKDNTAYIWGLTDGEGAPIELTPREYIAKYVYNKDYLSSAVIGLNTIVKTGNSLENVGEAFPDADFVEFHIPGEKKENEGLDWSSLKLVFEKYEGQYRLVAVIHSQWTI
jgi:hypothetical protein